MNEEIIATSLVTIDIKEYQKLLRCEHVLLSMKQSSNSNNYIAINEIWESWFNNKVIYED